MILRYLFLLFFVSFFLLSCKDDSRKNSKIPPPFSDTPDKRIQSAIEFLSKAISANPAVAENYFKRAKFLTQIGKIEEANEDIDEALTIKPSDGKYTFLKSSILSSLNKNQEAFKLAIQAESFGYNSPELNILLGTLSIKNNDLNKAELYLNKSLVETPYNADAYFNKGELSVLKKDTLAALAYFEKSKEYKPRNLATFLRLIDLKSSLKNFQEAKNEVVECNSYFTNNIQLLRLESGIYEKQGFFDSSALIHQRILKTYPKDLYSHEKLIQIFARWKSYFKAIEYSENLFVLDPKNTDNLNRLGDFYYFMGNKLKAEEILQKSISIKRQNNIAYDKLAKIQYSIDQELGLSNYNSIPKPQNVPVQTPKNEEVKPIFDTTRIKIQTVKPKIRQQIKIDSTRFKTNE